MSALIFPFSKAFYRINRIIPRFAFKQTINNKNKIIRNNYLFKTFYRTKQLFNYSINSKIIVGSTVGIFTYYYLNKNKFRTLAENTKDSSEDPSHFHLLETLRDLAPIIDAKVMLKAFVKRINDVGIDELHLDLEFLKEIFREAGVDDDCVAESIFRVMDWNKSGTLESFEIAATLTLFQVGKDVDRYKFLFRCLDLDGSGGVDKDEFRHVLTALYEAKYRLSGLFDDRDPDEWFYGMTVEDYHAIAKLKANMLVRSIFAWADQNRDGQLNMKEFLHWCKRGGYEVKVVKDLLTQTMEQTSQRFLR